METLSFVLGIAFVVVIALAVVATYAFVKVIKIRKEINELDQKFAHVYQCMGEYSIEINDRVDLFEKEIFGQLDSRLDKLQSKLNNKK